LNLKQAMVLTAGMSTRMRPLTDDIPKILLPCMGKNLFERMLDFSTAQGITSVAMNVFHGRQALLEEIRKSTHKVSVAPFEESPIKGTGGGIAGMKPFIKDDHFAVINCDFLTETVIGKMLQFHEKQNALATLLLIPHPASGKYGTVEVDENQKIISFDPKKKQEEIFAGIHIMSREIFKHFPSDHEFCIIKNVYEPLIKKGAPIFGYSEPVAWYDLGEVALYHRSLLALSAAPLSWMKDIRPNSSWIGPGVKLTKDINYQNSIIEKGAQVEPGTNLQNTIVFPNTNVKKGSYQYAILTPTGTIQI
jgi:NDP-sugar pyrophosphorylase family protein